MVLILTVSNFDEKVNETVLSKAQNSIYKNCSGNGIRIAILDSGVSESSSNQEIEKISFIEDGTVEDGFNHGTIVANIIKLQENAIAKEAELYSLKILENDGSGNVSDVIKAIQWCIENDIDEINMSFSMDDYSYGFEYAINCAIEKGIIIVCSISNRISDFDYPRLFDKVISVGVESTVSKKCGYEVLFKSYDVRIIGKNGKYENYEGNSFLAPCITGLIARILEYNKKNNISMDVKEVLEQVKKITQN